MILLTDDLRQILRANADAAASPGHDPVPAVKFFNPAGAATWLATEPADEGDTLFGLADLGFGCPELGSFSLSELAGVRLPFGLAVERDLSLATPYRLSTWAETARRAGSILWAETLLRRAGSQRSDELPPSGG